MILGNSWLIGLVATISCGVIGNMGRKMSNFLYFTVYVIWMILCMIIQFLPNNDTVVTF